jgi:hypothetical protein
MNPLFFLMKRIIIFKSPKMKLIIHTKIKKIYPFTQKSHSILMKWLFCVFFNYTLNSTQKLATATILFQWLNF